MKKITINTINGPVVVDYFEHVQRIMHMHAMLYQAAMSYYPKTGLSFTIAPYIVGITGACENVNTLFKINNKRNIPAFFNQTGQLALECYQRFAPGVFAIIHSGRDEGIEDERHLLEFSLTEEEFGWSLVELNKIFSPTEMFEHLLRRIEAAVKHLAGEVISYNRESLTSFGRNVNELEEILKFPFLRITYSEAVILLQQNGYPTLKWGDDLKAEHEQVVITVMNKLEQTQFHGLSHLSNRPVFITRYPIEIKFFNMMADPENPQVVLSADLILPISGESVGSAVREPDAVRLEQRLRESNMFRIHLENGGTYDDFTWYIKDVVGSGKIQPHAGYGLGNERLIQWLCGFPDIRHCAPFSLHALLTGDFDERRQGSGPIVSPQVRTILLSIADHAKEELLPSIAGIANNGIALYATEGTHNFLNEHGITATLVHKVSEIGQTPNLRDMLSKKILSTIINIPSPQDNQTKTDGEEIRKLAINTGTYLVTDLSVTNHLLQNLANKN